MQVRRRGPSPALAPPHPAPCLVVWSGCDCVVFPPPGLFVGMLLSSPAPLRSVLTDTELNAPPSSPNPSVLQESVSRVRACVRASKCAHRWTSVASTTNDKALKPPELPAFSCDPFQWGCNTAPCWSILRGKKKLHSLHFTTKHFFSIKEK